MKKTKGKNYYGKPIKNEPYWICSNCKAKYSELQAFPIWDKHGKPMCAGCYLELYGYSPMKKINENKK